MKDEQFQDKFAWVRALNDPNSGLTSTQHHIALALSEHLSREGKGYVTHATLALETRMSERSVCSALTALAEQHWIERIPGRVGWATTYVIAKKFGWEPTPPSERPKRPRRKPRHFTPTELHQRAKTLLTQLYEATGVDVSKAELLTSTTSRLLGALRKQLSNPATRKADLAKMWDLLTATSLSEATDPAAVLLDRYKQFLRENPHCRPVSMATS